MGLLKTHQDCLLFYWEILLKENKGYSSQRCHNGVFSTGWRMLQLKGWIGIKISQLELKTWFLAWMNVKTLTCSQQQPQGQKTHKMKSTIRLTIRTVFCAPKGCLFTSSWSCLKSSARHTLSNNLS